MKQFGDEGHGVLIELTDGVADVVLDRPGKLNALSPPLFAAMAEAIDWLAGREDVRCVVLSGAGRSFCSGIDLASLSEGVPPLGPRTRGLANLPQYAAWGWRELPVPVVAALHGHVFGGGLQIALGADVRIAAPDARLSVMEIRHGIVPDMGLFTLARGLVRQDYLREWVYTAGEFSGEQGVALGFVTRAHADPRAEALALAQRIAGLSPSAIRAAKRLLGRMSEDSAADLLQAESDEQDSILTAAMGRNDA